VMPPGFKKDGTPRKRRSCSKCGQPGHWANNCKSAPGASPAVTWNAHAARAKEAQQCTPSLSSGSSDWGLGSSATTPTTENLPPKSESTPEPIDLSAPQTPTETTATTATETPPPQPQPGATTPPPAQPRPTQAPPPSTSSKPGEDATTFGKMAGQQARMVLEIGNAYVEKHAGFVWPKGFLQTFEYSVAYMAMKYATENNAKPEDLAGATVVLGAAVTGGQCAYFGWQDWNKSKGASRVIDAKQPDARATQPGQGGRPIPLASVPPNTPTAGGAAPVVGRGGFSPGDYK